MKNYLCAARHHFQAPKAACPFPGCTAEVRETPVGPLQGRSKPFDKLPPLTGAPAPVAAPEGAPEGVKHSIRWHAYRDGARVRRTADMRDADYLWDATCSCGWDSATGGAAAPVVVPLAKAHKES